MNVLAIDTAGPVCSAALCCAGRDGPLRTSAEPRAHAQHVLALVAAVLEDAGLALADIDRYAFGRGPGGLTGLRVSASVVQGFGFVFERPVVAVSNLEAMALSALRGAQAMDGTNGVLACHDAQRGQVVWQFFGNDEGWPLALGEEALSAPGELVWRPGRWLAVGGGCAQLARMDAWAYAEDGATAGAAQIAALAARPDARTIAAYAAQPHYLRHPVTG